MTLFYVLAVLFFVHRCVVLFLIAATIVPNSPDICRALLFVIGIWTCHVATIVVAIFPRARHIGASELLNGILLAILGAFCLPLAVKSGAMLWLSLSVAILGSYDILKRKSKVTAPPSTDWTAYI